MHIHGGGQAISGPSSQNGWSKTFKVLLFSFSFFLVDQPRTGLWSGSHALELEH
jgi:hypothetical protein